jgi:diguanylate cyclase (GGDEF)-like protein/PAS domain S-box-containing protein
MVSCEPQQAQGHGLAALRVLFEQSPDGVLFTLPTEGRVVAANPAACAILRLSEEEIRGRGRQGLLDPDDARGALGLQELLRTGRAAGTTRVRRGDGSIIEAEITVNTFEGSDRTTWGCAIFRDMSGQTATQRQLDEMAAQLEELRLSDELTGLSNRRGLILTGTELLNLADRRSLEVQVLFVDVLGLAGLNERRGHDAGDAALLAVARALRVAFRRSDGVARLGGTLFAVVALDLHESGRAHVANRIADHLADPDTVQFVGEQVAVSLGWTTRHPGDPSALEDLMGQSDRAGRARRHV